MGALSEDYGNDTKGIAKVFESKINQVVLLVVYSVVVHHVNIQQVPETKKKYQTSSNNLNRGESAHNHSSSNKLVVIYIKYTYQQLQIGNLVR